MVAKSAPLVDGDLMVDLKDQLVDGLRFPYTDTTSTVLYVLDSRKRHQKVELNGNDFEPLLSHICSLISKNCSVKIIPSTALLTFDEVADTLNMTLSSLDKLRHNGTIDFTRHGLNYAVEAGKVFELKDKLDQDSANAFEQVIGKDQEMYYYDS